MVRKHTYNDLVWIDANSPTSEELRAILEEYSLHPIVVSEMTLPSSRPRIDVHEKYIYLVLHFPVFKHTHGSELNQEVDFVLGEKFLLTVRYGTIDAIHKFSKEFEVSTIINEKNIGDHAGYIFYHLLRKLYKSIEHELEYISSEIETIESDIFDEDEKREIEMVRRISETTSTLLKFNQVLTSHEEILDALKSAGPALYGNEFSHYIKSLANIYSHIRLTVATMQKAVVELRETNNSMINTKQNEVMKVLTTVAFITYPLTLIAGIFGMNTSGTPIVGSPHDFWVVIFIMTILTVGLFSFFKYRRWL